MSAKIMRIALLLALVAGLAGFGGNARASGAFTFADQLPDGVSFQTLAAANASKFRFHVAGTILERDAFDCSQATGKLFGKEQLIFDEWGDVEVHDWTSGERLATLHAGDAFGPTDEEQSVYLTALPGRRASVLRFGVTAASLGEPGVTPSATPSGDGCGASYRPAQATPLFNEQGAKAHDFALGASYTIYLGLLTIAPGAGFAAKSASQSGNDAVSTGAAVFAPLAGGLGEATSGGTGFGAVPGGANMALFHGMTLGGLINHGGWPLTILVAGTAPAGQAAIRS